MPVTFRDGRFSRPLVSSTGALESRVKPAPQQTTPPRPGEVTRQQPRIVGAGALPAGMGFGGLFGAFSPWNMVGAGGWTAGALGSILPQLTGLGALTGMAANPPTPYGWPGYAGLYLGTIQTYRWILSHPTVAHVRGQIYSMILANTWMVEEDENNPAPDGAKEEIEKYLDESREELLIDALRAIDFGFAGFEKVWDTNGDQYTLPRLKPLLADITQAVLDRNGNYAGLTQGTMDDALDVHKSWWVTWDGEAGAPYGRGRNENIRGTCWPEWLDAAQQLRLLGQKLAGMKIIIKVPAGTFFDKVSGQEVSFKLDAQAAATQLISNNAVILTNLAVEGGDDPELVAKLAQASLTDWEVVDMGNLSPAINGFLSRMRQAEELIFQGWLRSPRTGLDTPHGTKADAATHTETGVTDAEQIERAIARSFTRNVLDDWLTLNHGPKAKGTLRVKAAPLVDRKVATWTDLLKAAFAADGSIARSTIRIADMPKIMEGLDIPTLPDARFELEESAAPPVPDGSPAPANGLPVYRHRRQHAQAAPKPSGNGRMNGTPQPAKQN